MDTLTFDVQGVSFNLKKMKFFERFLGGSSYKKIIRAKFKDLQKWRERDSY